MSSSKKKNIEVRPVNVNNDEYMVRAGLRHARKEDTMFEIHAKNGLKRHTPSEKEKIKELKRKAVDV